MKIIKILAVSTVLVMGLVISCNSREKINDIKTIKTEEGLPKVKGKQVRIKFTGIDSVNFYFENSASMNGYIKGNNFLETMHRIVGNIGQNKISSYFVNTKEHKVNDVLNLIDNNRIKLGNTSNSDHKFIFTNAIQQANGNKLSIVVTDGIYSVNGMKPNIVAVDIERAFKNALQQNATETVVIKLTSKFKGTYYSESCNPGHKAININQDRPYYILLFGNSKVIDEALKEIVIENDLPGFNNKARFIITKGYDIKYSVLTMGKQKHGKVEPSNKRYKGDLKEIKVERFSRGTFKSTPKEENYVGFGIAVDYSKYSIPESYLTNISNYEVDDDTGYIVKEIKNINNLIGKTPKHLKGFTHIIVVKATKNLYGNLEIDLEHNLPNWINTTGLEDDCSIRNNSTQTFAFDQLIKGISDAYEKQNNNDEYLELKINIKPL